VTEVKRATTLGELKSTGYRIRSVKDEMRDNLVRKLRSGEKLFPGIVGYEDTVVPQIVNALLARQNFILLGLRGQAKSRIIRQLTTLLDDAIPIVEGSEVNDNPLRPISKYARLRIEAEGDATPIAWISSDARFIEKLATPDVTIADVIGDLDPIKAARGGHQLSDELTIHYGLLPRANRGIFAINEVPDLSGKIQVGLFNIMQEGGCPDQRLSGAAAAGRPARLHSEPRRLHGARQDHYAAEGSHWLGDHDALSRDGP
jgi:magnesium chelatase subunit I